MAITNKKTLNGFMAIIFFVLIISLEASAQNEVAIGSSTTKSNAILWLNGNGSQGLILPVVTNKSAVSNPDKGMVVFDDSDDKVYYHSGADWVEVGGGGGATSNPSLLLEGNQLQLKDGTTVKSTVNLAAGTQSNGAFLVFTGGSWQYATLSGDVTGANGALQVNGVKGKTIPTLPATTQALVYDGTAWKFQALTAGTDTQTLTFTSPNLSISNGNSVNLSTLDKDAQTLSLTGNSLSISGGNSVTLPAAGTVTSITAGAGLTGGTITNSGTINVDVGTTANKIVQLDATGKLPAVDGSLLTNLAGGGDITGVTAGTGLTGGGLSGSVTIAVDAGTTANKIVQLDGTGKLPAVDGSQLTNLPSTAIADGSITGGSAGTGVKIAANTITDANILSLNAGKITAGTLPLAQVPNLDASKITTGTFTAAQIPNLDAAKITSGVLPTTQGGTGISFSSGSIGNGQLLIGNSGSFAKANLTSGAGINITNGTGTISIATTGNFGSQNLTTSGTLNAGATSVSALTINGATWPANASGVLTNNGSGTLTWTPSGGTGTVTSVGLAMPSIFTVTNSPITTSGTLTTTLASQTAATVFAAPPGSAGVPTFRGLLSSDIPNLDASKITSGTLPVSVGGTGRTTWNGLLLGSGSTISDISTGTAGQVLKVVGTSPSWQLITDTNIDPAAAINGSKIIPNFGTQALTSGTSTTFGTLTYTWPATTGVANSVLTNNGAGVLGWAAGGWSLTGNAGTNPATNFIGTTDAQPLRFSTGVGGVERMRIDAAGKIGIGVVAPTAGFDMLSNDGMAVKGTFGSGVIPSSGAGTRMMFYPRRAAFRAGRTFNEFGTESVNWDDANVGDDSFAVGLNTTASGIRSFAGGRTSTAAGSASVAIGDSNQANSFASVAMGFQSVADGQEAVAMGRYAKATSRGSVAFGHFNIGGGDPDNFVSTDPLFELGNGTGTGALRKNAFTVLKNGKTSINGSAPTVSLEVNGTDALLLPVGTTAQRPSSSVAGYFRYNSSNSSVEFNNGSSWQSLGGGSGWGLTGNTGTVDATSFIGTIDNVPLNFRVNSQKAGRIETDPLTANSFFGYLAGNSNGSYYNTGIGYNALSSTVAGGYYNTAIGTNALSVNTTGFVNTATGGDALRFNTTGAANAAFGANSLRANTTGGNNTALGSLALTANTTGGSNVAAGTQSLSSNTSGNLNTALGFYALIQNTVGGNNTAMGGYSLFNNVAGSNATAIGYGAMERANNTGSAFINTNVAVGYQSLRGSTTPASNTGLDNTAIGYESLVNNSSGSFNTAIGRDAMALNTTGEYNTAVGYNALRSLSSGGGNVGVGDYSLFATSATFNNSALGKYAGSSNTGDLNVFVGSFSGNENSTGDNNTFVGAYADATTGNNNLTNATAIGYFAKVDASNKVRIGNTSVTVIQGQVGFTAASDRRLKTDIQDIGLGIDFIKKLRPVTYLMKAGDSRQNWGFIAQDIEALVGTDKAVLTIGQDSLRSLGLRYTDFIAPMVNAMQEQQKMIEDQQKMIDSLQARDAHSKKQIASLEASLQNMQSTDSEMQKLKAEIETIKKALGLTVEASLPAKKEEKKNEQ